MMYPYPGDRKASEMIYKKFGQLSVYSFILGFNVDLDAKYPSPFRDDGSTPSFNVYVDKDNIVRWNDHGRLDNKLPIHQRDCIGLLMQLEDITRLKAISKIWSSDIQKLSKPDKTKAKVIPYLKIRTIWRDYEYNWWNFINRSLLKKHRVYPTDELKYGSKVFNSTPSSPSFTYLYGTRNESWKVYNPNLTIDKWKTHNIKQVIDGWEQLPLSGDKLYIVSSKKDGLVMETYLGYPFIAPSNENAFTEILKRSHEINSRFKQVVVSLDSDRTGRVQTDRISELTGWNKVYLPCEYKGVKDQTDIVIKLGILNLKSLYLCH